MNKLLTAHPIVPVVVIERIEDAVPLAEALVAGGLPVLEVTLRTDAAIPGIKQIIKHVPEAIVMQANFRFPRKLDVNSSFLQDQRMSY